jgi:uncharacterized protein YuzE
MVFEYYADTDMLYIRFAEGTSVESEEVAPGVVLDFDEQNRILGVEVVDESKVVDLARLELRALPIADLLFRERAPAGT